MAALLSLDLLLLLLDPVLLDLVPLHELGELLDELLVVFVEDVLDLEGVLFVFGELLLLVLELVDVDVVDVLQHDLYELRRRREVSVLFVVRLALVQD